MSGWTDTNKLTEQEIKLSLQQLEELIREGQASANDAHRYKQLRMALREIQYARQSLGGLR